jgi:hypothetical protein
VQHKPLEQQPLAQSESTKHGVKSVFEQPVPVAGTAMHCPCWSHLDAGVDGAACWHCAGAQMVFTGSG